MPQTNRLIWIRFSAALMIMLSHSTYLIPSADYKYYKVATFLTWLLPGVPMLFLISGFLVFLSARFSESLLVFFLKRALRIYPPLWSCFILSLFAMLITGVISTGTDFSHPHFYLWIIGQLTFVQFYNPDFLRDFGVGAYNGTLWVVPVILQFYIALPIFLRFLDQQPNASRAPLFTRLLITAALANFAFAICWELFGDTLVLKLVKETLFPWAFVFFLGAYLSYTKRALEFVCRWKWVLTSAYILTAITLYLSGIQWSNNNINPISMSLLGSSLVGFAFSVPISGMLARAEQWLKENDFTFGLFVYHMIVMNFIIEFLSDWPIPLKLITFFVVSIATAFLSMRFVERPIRLGREKLIDTVQSLLKS